MNSSKRNRIEELVATAPELLPASIVALDYNARKALLIQTEWKLRYQGGDDLTPTQLAAKAARFMAESAVEDQNRADDAALAERIVDEIRTR